MANKKIEIVVSGDSRQAEKMFRGLGKSADSFGDRMKKAGKFAAIGVGAGLGVAAVAAKKFVDKALEAEKAQVRLDGAFKIAGVSAREQAAAMVAVSRVSQQAALDDEDLMDSLGRLTRLTGDAAKAQTLMGTAADIARARNISLEAATGLVAKAQLGQLGALKRMGIEIPKVTTAQDALGKSASASQKAAAKAADEMATRTQAVAALQRQFAGESERYGQSNAAAVERAGVAWENFQEMMGAKLLPVVSRVLTWVTTNMPKWEAAVSRAMDRGREAAAQFMAYYDGTLKPTITSVINTLQALWGRFGTQLTAIAKTFVSQLKNIINTFLAVLRGDWGAAWEGVKAIVRNAVSQIGNLLRLSLSVWGAVAKALGTAIWNGVKAGIANLASAVTTKLTEARNAVVNAATTIYGNALAVGKRLVQGIIDGVTGMAGALMEKIGGLVSQAKAKLKFWDSPPESFGSKIGRALIQGMITGIDATLPQLTAKSQQIVEAVKAQLQAGRTGWDDAWAGYTSSALAAFDDLASKAQTKSEKILASMRKAKEVAGIKEGVASAQSDLDAARASGDQEAIVNAQKALDEALYRQKEYGLEQRAMAERKKLDEQTAVRRMKFEEQLAEMGPQFLRMLARQGEGHGAILAKLKTFEKRYKLHGKSLGDNLAIGLDDAYGGVVEAAQRLARAIAKILNLRGQISIAVDDATGAGGKNPSGKAAGGPVWGGRTYLVGERGPELFTPPSAGTIIPNGGMTGGGAVNITLHVTGLGSPTELAHTIRDELIKIGRRSGGNVLGGMA